MPRERIPKQRVEALEWRSSATTKAEPVQQWLEENKQAIESINAFIDRHGLVSSRLRYRPDCGY